MEPKTKAELEAAVNASFFVAALDLIIATLCAVNGNEYFAPFMLLAGLMAAYGAWIKSKIVEGD